MGHLDFYNKLNSMQNKEYIETFLVYNLSLVIAGIKPAVTITMNKDNLKLYTNWKEFGGKFLKNINMKFINLREKYNSIIIMIYDGFILKEQLSVKHTMEFLLNIGYPSNACINDYVNTLKLRYEKYHCPHELGLFLGIPFEDVKDFMECTTKQCLLCGYWKVYNDTSKAKMIFESYDKIKEFTKNDMLKGKSSHTLALSIKNNFYEHAKYM
jgi:hypothetical protein